MARQIREPRLVGPQEDSSANGVWRTHYYDPTTKQSKRISRGTDEGLARRQHDIWLQQYKADRLKDLDLTLANIMDAYLNDIEADRAGFRTRRSWWLSRLAPTLANVTVAECLADPKLLDKFFSTVKRGTAKTQRTPRVDGQNSPGFKKIIGAGYLRGLQELLVSGFNHAVKEGKLARGLVPVINKEPLAGKVKRVQAWEYEDRDRVLAAAADLSDPEGHPHWLHMAVWLGIFTGARPSDVCHLEWSMVRLGGAKPIIEYTKMRRCKNPQSRKNNADSPIAPPLLALLRRAYAHRLPGQTRVVYDPPGRHHLARNNVDRAKLRHALVAMLRGMDPPMHGHPHAWRHTFVTHMRHNGVSLADIAVMIGDTVRMVEQVYSHLKSADLHDHYRHLTAPAGTVQPSPVVGVIQPVARGAA